MSLNTKAINKKNRKNKNTSKFEKNLKRLVGFFVIDSPKFLKSILRKFYSWSKEFKKLTKQEKCILVGGILLSFIAFGFIKEILIPHMKDAFALGFAGSVYIIDYFIGDYLEPVINLFVGISREFKIFGDAIISFF